MDLIILLIIIFFVWRHIKKKKADRAEARAEYQTRMQVESDPTLGPVIAPKKDRLRGKPVTEDNFPKKMKDVYEGAEHFGKIRVEDPEDPDMAFACTKRAFEKNSQDIDNITIELNEDSESSHCLRWGVRLAEFYRDGYGCEPDAQAAIDILSKIDPLWVRLTAYAKQRLQANRLSREQAEYANKIISLRAEAWGTLADCCAITGQGHLADEFYRQTYEMANLYGNPDYVREQVIRHAMGDYPGDYGGYSSAFPRPMRVSAAMELALSMAGQNKPMGGHFLMALVGIRNLDLDALGQSWETDFRIYSSAEDSYSLYRTGLAMLYGLGTEQNVKVALARLVEAYEQGSVMAAHLLYEYYNGISESPRLDKAQKTLAENLSSDWARKYERMIRNSDALEKIKATGVADEAMRECASKYTPSKLDMEDEDVFVSAGETSQSAGDTRLSDLPNLITDDNGRDWEFERYVGEAREYRMREEYSPDLDMKDALNNGTVLIEQRHIHGRTAVLFSRTFHW